MVRTTVDQFFVNDVELHTLAKNIDSLTGRLRTPPRRTQAIQVAGRHGSLPAKTKLFGENVLALPMWVIGCNDDGAIPSGSNAKAEFHDRVDELTRLFMGSVGQLEVRWIRESSHRRCYADVLDVIDFTKFPTPFAKFAVSLVLADPFWYDFTQITQTIQANGASASFSSFAGATAPMEKIRFQLTGPWNNPVLTFSDGSWVAWDGNIPAGATVTFNSDTWGMTSSGVTTILAQLRRGGGGTGRWATIPPTSDPIVVSLAGTSRTTATQLQLQGRRAFMTG